MTQQREADADTIRTLRAKANIMAERLQLARLALIGSGYFTEDEVGDDVSPRIIELVSALKLMLDRNHLHEEWGYFGHMAHFQPRFARIYREGCEVCVLIGRSRYDGHDKDAGCPADHFDGVVHTEPRS